MSWLGCFLAAIVVAVVVSLVPVPHVLYVLGWVAVAVLVVYGIYLLIIGPLGARRR